MVRIGKQEKRLIVIGIDGLGYSNLMHWPGQCMQNLRRLCKQYTCCRINLDVAISPRNWVRIFAGIDLKWYNLYIKKDRVVKGVDYWRLIRRIELPVKFIWDIYRDLVVINAPVVIPPIVRNSDFKPIEYGLPFNFYEWMREVSEVRRHALKAIRDNDSVIAVFTVIDRMLHITADDKVVRRVSIELDEAVRILVEEAVKRNYYFIIISDHGMKRVNKEVHGSIAPRHDMPYIRTVTKAIHEHEENALYISNTGISVKKLEDVFFVMKKILG